MRTSISNKFQLLFSGMALALLQVLPLQGNADWPFEGSDLSPDSRVVYGHLSNGIRYAILPWQEPPGRVSIQMLVEAGWIHETDRQIGLAHLIEHMAFNGTENFSAGEMVEYFQRLGMAFGADTNAHTWWRETVYKLEMPDTAEALLRDGLQLLRDYADGMLLSEEEINKEKGVVLNELRERDTPGSRAWREELKFALPDSRITTVRTMSEMDIVRMSTRQDLVDFYSKWYIPENLALVAVGDVDPAELVALFEEYFADMENPEQGPQQPDLGTIRPETTKTGMFSHPELPSASLKIFKREPIEKRPESMETMLASLRMSLANFAVSRRFQRLALEENSPITSGYAYDYRWLDTVRYTGIGVGAEPLKWQEALAVVTAELRRALEFGFTENEINEGRQNMLTQLREAAERESSRRSRDLVNQLVRSIRDHEVFMDPVQMQEVFSPMVAAMTADEIYSVFKQAWAGDERMVWVSGDFAKVLDQEFATAMEAGISAPDAKESVPFAYTESGQEGTVVESRYIEDLDATQVVFANGVRLNIKKTDFEAGSISVKLSFGEGEFSAPVELPGMTTFAGNVFIEGGLGKHSYEDLKAYLAERTASIGFGIEPEFFSLSGTTNNADLDFQLQLISAYLTDPGFRPEARRLLMRQLDGYYTRLAHDPNMVLRNEGARFLASGDVRFGVAERAELESRTLEEAAEWLAPALREGYAELAIVGDIENIDGVIAAVGRTLGSLPARASAYSPDPKTMRVSLPQAPVEKVLNYSTSNPLAVTTVHWGTIDRRDAEQVRRVSILGEILGDRMRKAVREEAGESYSPYAFNSSQAYLDFGYIRAFAGVHPDSVNLVTDIILQQAKDLVESGADADELLRAVEPIKSQTLIQRRTNRYWVESVLLRSQTEPQRLDWARSYLEFWDTVTVEEINDLARRLLPADRAIVIHVLPN